MVFVDTTERSLLLNHSRTPGHLRTSSFGARTGSFGTKGTPERSRLTKNRSQTLLSDIQSPAVSENFFDFREKGVDIWDEDNLVANLKKDNEKQGGGQRYARTTKFLSLSVVSPSP